MLYQLPYSGPGAAPANAPQASPNFDNEFYPPIIEPQMDGYYDDDVIIQGVRAFDPRNCWPPMRQMHVSEPGAEDLARDIALRTLFSGYDVLLACRDLVSLRSLLPNVPMSIMDTFVGIESEVDDLPLGGERRLWASEALIEKDLVAAEYRELVREIVLAALRNLLIVLRHTRR